MALRQDDVEVPFGYCAPGNLLVSPSLCAQQGSFLTSLVGYGYTFDRRNDPIESGVRIIEWN